MATVLHLHYPSSENYAVNRPQSVFVVTTRWPAGTEEWSEVPSEQINTIELVEHYTRRKWWGLSLNERRNGAAVQAVTDRGEVVRSYSLPDFAEELYGAPLVAGKHMPAAEIVLEMVERVIPRVA